MSGDFTVDATGARDKTTATAPSVSPISGAELWGKEFPNPRWLIESIWPDQSCGFISGPSGARKTWLSLELSLSVATGTPALGRFNAPHPGPVLYIAGEDQLRNLQSRMRALALGRGINAADLSDLHFAAEQGVLASEGTRERLATCCQRLRPRLIILDPLVRMHSADENSAKEFQPILAFLRKTQREYGVSILLTHHSRKSRGDERGGGRKMEALRGTGDLGAWADTVLSMDRTGESPESPSLVSVSKQRDVPEAEPFMLTLEFAQDSARLEYHEGDARSLRVHKVMEDALGLLRKLGAPEKGMLKKDLEAQLTGGHEIKRDAIERLEAQKRISMRLLTCRAKDKKARKQKFVFLVETTFTGKEQQGLAGVPPAQPPTPAAPLGGAGVGLLGREQETEQPPGQPLSSSPSRQAAVEVGDFAELNGMTPEAERV